MNDRLIIRLATVKDAEPIAIESMAEIEHNLSWSWTPGRVHSAISDPDTNVAVAHDEKGMVAFGIMVYRDDTAHLQLFAVREDARRRGVGSDVLRWLEHVARVAGVTHFQVEARRNNIPALGFYRHHGYCEREDVRGMYQGIEDGIRLEKVDNLAVKEA